jgi:hypothetical protein
MCIFTSNVVEQKSEDFSNQRYKILCFASGFSSLAKPTSFNANKHKENGCGIISVIGLELKKEFFVRQTSK